MASNHSYASKKNWCRLCIVLLCSAFTARLYYEYHYGYMYVHLKQLIPFKQRLGEPEDVPNVERFMKGAMNATSHPFRSKSDIRNAQHPGLNKDDIVWHLQSGASLGKYRQGGPFNGDSDVDIVIVRNYECARDVYDTLPQRVARCKRPGSRISLNNYDQWGDFVSNLTQTNTSPPFPRLGHAAMKALTSTLTYISVDSTGNVRFFIRKPEFLLQDFRREYGPAWFVPSSTNHGLYTANLRLGYQHEKVRSSVCKDIDKYEDANVDVMMNELGVTGDGYAKISAVERCKANKWFAWVARFCKGETELPAKYVGLFLSGSTAWTFPECVDHKV